MRKGNIRCEIKSRSPPWIAPHARPYCSECHRRPYLDIKLLESQFRDTIRFRLHPVTEEVERCNVALLPLSSRERRAIAASVATTAALARGVVCRYRTRPGRSAIRLRHFTASDGISGRSSCLDRGDDGGDTQAEGVLDRGHAEVSFRGLGTLKDTLMLAHLLHLSNLRSERKV